VLTCELHGGVTAPHSCPTVDHFTRNRRTIAKSLIDAPPMSRRLPHGLCHPCYPPCAAITFHLTHHHQPAASQYSNIHHAAPIIKEAISGLEESSVSENAADGGDCSRAKSPKPRVRDKVGRPQAAGRNAQCDYKKTAFWMCVCLAYWTCVTQGIYAALS